MKNYIEKLENWSAKMLDLAPNNSPTIPRDIMRQLSLKTEALNTAILPRSSVGYVDYPMHINVGDLLIFLGAMNFFKWNNNSIPSFFCLFDARASAFDSLEEVDVIACHGGGNFGDIYPAHQDLRHNIIKAFPNKPVVIMPQSFHFSSDESMRNSAKIFTSHDNVTIYVRDQPSFDIARKHFSDQVFLSPDMAHRLYDEFTPIRQHARQTSQEFRLMRRDVEAIPGQFGSDTKTQSYDWRDIMSFIEKLRIERHRRASKLSGTSSRPDPKSLMSYHRTINSVVKAIAKRVAGRSPWTTSRLHGAILGLLLDRDILLCDNSYGKNSRYFLEWAPDLVTIA